MKFPKEVNSYCKFCQKHTEQVAKKLEQQHSPSKKRTMSKGQLRHSRKTKGYTSKLATKKERVKQSSRNWALMECKDCKKKTRRTLTGRTRKKTEYKREEAA
ncbi:MAG: hypothetical protein J4432_00505 [DPANN group archaeon]|nr:hypothetical protein [DPANN group archaeon]